MKPPKEKNSQLGSKSKLGYKTGLFFFTVVIGICSLSYEYTFSKLSSDLLGSSHAQWALIIGIMLLAMGLGADYQKRMGDKNLFPNFFFLEILLSFLGGWGPLCLYFIFAENREYYLLGQFFFTFSTGFIIGLEVPILLRLNKKHTGPLKMNLAQIFRADYIGGFLGSLLWIFILIQYWSSTLQVGFSLALINLLGLALALIIFNNYYVRKKLLWFILIATTFVHSMGLFYFPRINLYLEQKLFRDLVIHSETSPFQQIVVTKSKADHYSLYLNGHLQFNTQDEFVYHEFLVHPAAQLVKKKENVLILGGGDGLAAREVLRYSEVKNVVLVDIDSAITDLFKNHPVLREINDNSFGGSKTVHLTNQGLSLENGKEPFIIPEQRQVLNDDGSGEVFFQILNLDAYVVAQKMVGNYDLIILDFPDPHAPILGKLYSLSFYSFLRKKLNPGGILVQQSSSPFFAKKAFLLIGRTLEKAGFKAIPYRANVPSFGLWGWYIAYSKNDPYFEDFQVKLDRLSLNDVEVNHLTGALIRNAFAFPKNYFANQVDDYNSIINNLIHRYYLDGVKNF